VLNLKDSIVITGIPSDEELAACPGVPTQERMKRGRVAVIECVQEIPCNPCEEVCSHGAITVGGQITALPVLDGERCTGCGLCIAGCPGLAIFVVDKSRDDGMAVVEFPFEYIPLPAQGDIVTAVSRAGDEVCAAEVLAVKKSKAFDGTVVVSLLVPYKHADVVRGMKRLPRKDGDAR
jgi:Fe-S-cluster-containing hydrogenase component 2